MAKKKKITAVPQDAAWLIQDVLTKLGWEADATEVAERVRRLDIGLPLEDEFSVICAWLGKCQLLHKLDQQQVPADSRNTFQVPDLLARFSTQTNKSPVLIEVKSRRDDRLELGGGYLRRLQNYADLLSMPLLIAWKYHRLWILFEAKHLKVAKTSFRISWNEAMRENLLGALAGDVAYSLGSGTGVRLRFRKDKLVKKDAAENIRTEHWHSIVDQVAFVDHEGKERTDLAQQVQSLFFASDLEPQEEHTESHIHLRYVAGEGQAQFAHMSLVNLLNWETSSDGRPHWRNYLQKSPVSKTIADFSAALSAGLREKFVFHIFHQQPNTAPDFLSPVENS